MPGPWPLHAPPVPLPQVSMCGLGVGDSGASCPPCCPSRRDKNHPLGRQPRHRRSAPRRTCRAGRGLLKAGRAEPAQPRLLTSPHNPTAPFTVRCPVSVRDPRTSLLHNAGPAWGPRPSGPRGQGLHLAGRRWWPLWAGPGGRTWGHWHVRSPLESCNRQVWWPGEVKGWTQVSGFGGEPVALAWVGQCSGLDAGRFVGMATAG